MEANLARVAPIADDAPFAVPEGSVRYAEKAACAGRDRAAPFCMVLHDENGRADLCRFETAFQAFVYAEKLPHLVSAELWTGMRLLCTLRQYVCAQGSFWQVISAPRQIVPAS